VTTSRVPVGLTLSMFVAAISLGLMSTCWNLAWPVAPGLQLVVHCGAALCFGWAAVSLLLNRVRPNLKATQIGHDLQAVLQIATIVTGLLAIILMVYTAATEALCRAPDRFDYQTPWRVEIWRSGFLDLGLVAGAVVLSWGRTRDPQLITVCFWILVLAGLWLSLQIPAVQTVRTQTGGSYPDTTRWAIPFVVWNAFLIAALTMAGGIRHQVRRVRAWPNALSNLTVRPQPWPGFRYSVGIIAALLLVLGCVHIVSPWTTASAFVAGGSIFVMVTRRWEENLAEIAVGLVTLGIVSLSLLWLPRPTAVSPDYYAGIFNRVVFGLAATTWLWHWLAGVWHQQLDHGQPWTTAGRLIRTVQRIGYLCGVTGVLVSLHLAFWPKFPVVDNLDDSLSRWIGGLAANGLLVLALIYSARRTKKSTLAWLVLFAVASTVAFTLIRLGDSPVAQWWVLHWPIVMPLLAAASLVLAAAAARSDTWRPFAEPLLLLGVMVAPIAGVAGVLLTGELATMPGWIPAMVFGLLVGVYLLAAVLPGPRSYAVLAAICTVMALWHLRQLRGGSTLTPPHFYGVLVGLSAVLFGLFYRRPPDTGMIRFLKWAGGVLVVISLLAGLLTLR